MPGWSLTPYVMVADAAAAIAFYKAAFGATERYRMTTPDGGKIVHAELDINGARFMLSDDMGMGGGSGTGAAILHLDVPDADTVQAQAAAAGATVTMPVAEMFWGARYGKLTDPSGIAWSVATQVRQPSEEEIKAAIAKMCGSHGNGSQAQP